MAFGKRESYNEERIAYEESLDMLLMDLKSMGHVNLTKDELLKLLTTNFSIGRAVRLEVDRILTLKI